ncbi:hypothetical protein [Helicobacter bizzozeronii]|uniref:hypothetical protein n=1 Tax=Helicobacter bizzozeronii TaxID=56877 RepID=UPI000CEF00DB|nr:hypothetical protein [Helicobacter bizzozeronii]
MRILLLLGVLLWVGCGEGFHQAYKPDFLAEKRTQATRKGEIIQNLRPVVSVFATHLNDVDPVLYHEREFFFVEVLSQDASIYENDLISYKLYGTRGALTPMWSREISKAEFDGVLYTTNRYARGYLVAFSKLDYLSVQEAKLEIDFEGLGTILLNFAYRVPVPMF